MDGTKFDAWTRALALGRSRRQASKLMISGAFAGVAMRGALRGVAACTDAEGAPCDPQFGCCEDAGLACKASQSGGVCVSIGDAGCKSTNQSNQCVTGPRCEGKGCKKKKKGKKKRK
jgi:hypothetical protein